MIKIIFKRIKKKIKPQRTRSYTELKEKIDIDFNQDKIDITDFLNEAIKYLFYIGENMTMCGMIFYSFVPEIPLNICEKIKFCIDDFINNYKESKRFKRYCKATRDEYKAIFPVLPLLESSDKVYYFDIENINYQTNHANCILSAGQTAYFKSNGSLKKAFEIAVDHINEYSKRINKIIEKSIINDNSQEIKKLRIIDKNESQEYLTIINKAQIIGNRKRANNIYINYAIKLNMINIDYFHKIKLLNHYFYKGDNPDSLYAWFGIDDSNTENNIIKISDKYGDFEWSRKTNNKNVISKNKYSIFSFYFTRYAFCNKRILEIKKNRKYTTHIAVIYGSDLQELLIENNINKNINKDGIILLKIDNINNGNVINILKSELVTSKYYINKYINYTIKRIYEKENEEDGKIKRLTIKYMKQRIIQDIYTGTKELLEVLKDFWDGKYEKNADKKDKE